MDFSIIVSIPLLFAFIYIMTTLLHKLVLDWSRSRMFALRGEMFDYACANNYDLFLTDIYKDLESSINKIIYSLNIMKPSIYTAFMLANRPTVRAQIRNQQKKENRKFNRYAKQLQNEDDRVFFTTVRRRLENEQLIYVFASSWFMMGILAITFIISIIRNIAKAFVASTSITTTEVYRNMVKRDVVDRARSIEASAVGYSDPDRLYQKAVMLS